MIPAIEMLLLLLLLLFMLFLCVVTYTHAATCKIIDLEKEKYERANTYFCSYSILTLCSEKKKKEIKIFRMCFAYLLTTERKRKRMKELF